MDRPGGVSLNQALGVDDFGNGTLLLLIERLEASNSFQQYIAREAEMDDVWRHVETALKNGRSAGAAPDQVARLQRLLDAVMAAHDLVAGDEPLEAAGKLRGFLGSA